MAIKVRLRGDTVTVHPAVHAMNRGKRPVEWRPHENSDTFTFDDPPITFDDPGAPFTGITASGDSASGTDDNSATADTDYGYHVHLIDADGNHITYPAKGGTMPAGRSTQVANARQGGDGLLQSDPVIRNRPT
ncbi:hypothetical protein MQC88_07555 [Luteimonas sp. 50]|uniref:Uncharacterized protein n=1 Tax=Cognatiluteimonas sedimenti TaxID=2927791 RepID=A0ABT0A4A5_9GAMM|nr:hypothetical protein [Lysobacter sedimenti]MCJ0825811.1 hypothetical protein [Lysobacter sedimenti]